MPIRHILSPRFRISAKVAIYSPDFQQVLVMQYRYKHGYGLPGGHVEKGETPEVALRRELQEEIGATLGAVERKDFFLRNSKDRSMILAFTAIAPVDFTMNPPRPDFEKGIWLTRPELEALEKISPAYKEFTLAHWPV